VTLDLLVTNGTIVTPETSSRGHVLIQDGRVLDILTRDGALPPAREVIDASGLHVLPGLIDPHVHFRAPGLEYKEDWHTGSQAAACGGITTVLDMPNVVPPTSTVEALEAKLARARDRSYVDYGSYAVIVSGNMNDLLPLAEAGVVGYKVYLGETVGNIPPPPDGEIIDAWRLVAETGLRSGVHAENTGIIAYLRQKLQAQGRRDPVAHLESRPAVAEAEAISRALLFAREAGSRLMIHHMSASEGVALLRRAREAGADVMGETCPHYLLMTAEDMIGRGLGSLLKINPPVRSREDGETLWRGLRDGTIEVMGTDHSPHTPEEKMAAAPMEDIWKAASGFPGVETGVPLMLTQVNAGRLTLSDYVRLQAEGPARAWALWPRKGALARGADGDLTIVDMRKDGVIDRNRLHSKSKVTPFHGFPVKGMPVYTIVRGTVVMRAGELDGTPTGRFIRPSR
jgi:dihydroorotase